MSNIKNLDPVKQESWCFNGCGIEDSNLKQINGTTFYTELNSVQCINLCHSLLCKELYRILRGTHYENKHISSGVSIFIERDIISCNLGLKAIILRK